MKITPRPIKRARIEIIPMIDVIFFLLVFFMVASLSNDKTHQVPVALPNMSVKASVTAETTITLTLKKDGTLYLNQTQITPETEAQALAAVMQQDPQQTVIIRADENANYGKVIHIMDIARSIGVQKFSLATESK